MEFLEQQHKKSVVSNPDRGCFEKKTLEDSVDQNLDMILVEMKFEAFAPKVAKGSVHQCYNLNYDNLDSVDMYNQVAVVTSHKMVDLLVNK